MNFAAPISDQIDIEESCPGDALGLNSPAELWDHFSEAGKAELLALAKADDALYASPTIELTAIGEQYVIPGAERVETRPGKQLGLWS